VIAAALAAFFMLSVFGLAAYAAEPEDMTEYTEYEVVTEYAPAPEEPGAMVRPFTPSGTGTVIDYATDTDGKLFYTIMTPDEHVFYLVIDKQRGTENLYFLNAVTIADLAALAEIPLPTQGGAVIPLPPVDEPPSVKSPPPPEDEPQQGGDNMGMYIFIAVIAIIGGGAGWYFKIYRPKQQGAASGDEYEPSMDDTENDYADDDWGEDSDETGDAPQWDEDGDEGESRNEE